MLITSKICKLARKRLLQMHYESGVGHIGGNLSSLDLILLVMNEFTGHLDRFILSKGHSAGALYIALWQKGVISDEELKSFHQDDTMLPGHPPCFGFSEIPFATGSLGHGLPLAAGIAMAKRLQGDSGHVYCLVSDGECQEGSTWEALVFISHHQLNNITVLVDHNQLQGFGFTNEISSLEPLNQMLINFQFSHYQISGHDLDQMRKTLAVKTDYPKLIILESIKGKGVSFMENKMEWHYLPLQEKQYLQAIQEIEAI